VKSSFRAIKYLYSLEERGIKFGLRNIRILLASVGNPHRQFPAIHIAGTNGKGSTCSFLASIAMEGGCKTGLYTSPHVVRFTERICIDGKEIAEDELAEYVQDLRPSIEATGATFFEATTCIAFRYFADRKVDVAIIETGLGGRLDATNVVRPLLSVITNVSADHLEFLGSTLRSIAKEKGGIIKPGIPCVTASTDSLICRTLSTIAQRRHTKLYRAADLVRMHKPFGNVRTQSIDLWGQHVRAENNTLGLPGSHQGENARLACAAIELLHRQEGALARRFTNQAIARGLRRVRINTSLRGRLESIGRRKQYILDVGHNPDAMKTIAKTLRENSTKGFVVVFGVMRDKEYTSMIQELAPVAAIFVTVQAKTRRSLPEGVLRREIGRQNLPVRKGGSVLSGLTIARKLAGKKLKVLVTGSHYVVGEAASFLDRRT